ncbi:MAG TPA: TonB-dependent receptor [Candidatus Marinimicrobia bacterium]|nr:TonB-dependent receptor [Candidatus Neomarinimicrobiota bacterium]
MKNRYLSMYVFLLIFFGMFIRMTNADPGPATRGSIKGFVYDRKNNKPVEYANVVLYWQRSHEQVTGTITDANGYFNLNELRPGIYILEIKFIGFDAFHMDSLVIRPSASEVDLGRIEITPDVLAMGSVEVVGEKPIIEFQIDKKVINVSQQFTSLSGTAVDVLENVPSVSVDIEGNVSLRGSGSFNLLIDGRPSVLDANDALQTIPASSIENIEIVTNPSAKYDPDGVAGVINIITKKSEKTGIAGLVNTSIGSFGNHSADFLLNIKKNQIGYFIGADYGYRNFPGNMMRETRTYHADTTTYDLYDGASEWSGRSLGLRGGIDLQLTDSDLLRLSLRYGTRSGGRDSETEHLIYEVPGSDTTVYISNGEFNRSGAFYSLNLDYRHKFKKEGHELSNQIDLGGRGGDEKALSEEYSENGTLNFGQRSTESGPGKRIRYKLDYMLPLQNENKIEAGYQSRYSVSVDDNTMNNWNADSNAYVPNLNYYRKTDYTRAIQSLYLIYAGKTGNFGYQGGLRGEYTYQFIEMSGVDSSFSVDEWDIYPTLHASYFFNNGQQLMASYTRRIDRVRGWYLEPFETWMDAKNVRRGNAGLKPEYIDSYETGYQKTFGKSLLSVEAYYRITHNKIERVQTLYPGSEGIILHTYDNIGKDYAFGTETMLTLIPVQWWNLNLMGNLYNYRVKGLLYNVPFDESSFNWSLRVNNTFRLSKSSRIQFSANYRSPTVSAQGRDGEMFFTNLAFRQEFLDRKLSATLQIRDLFGTASHYHRNEGPNFYSYSRFERQPRMLFFTLTYNINNYKKDRERNGGQENGIEFDDENNIGFE